jgi:hypothetical protein
MIFAQPIPFVEAVKHLAAKRLMPTGMNSAGLKQVAASVRRQSLFSAETTLVDYLDEVKRVVESVVDPKQVVRYDAEGKPLEFTVTEGFNPASAREALRNKLKELGYQPGEDQAGSIKDLSSDARINLVVKTNVELAEGAGKYVQGNLNEDVVDLWPAWELVRYESRKDPRDWEQRWRIAAQVANDPKAAAALELHGKLAALKSSGIWRELGDGAGGFEDTLGNPYPPFAFNSGMWTEDVSREEAEAMGLIEPGEEARKAELDLETLFGGKAES